jgi:hypothetical protein
VGLCLPIAHYRNLLDGQVQIYGIGCMLCMPTELGSRFVAGSPFMVYQVCASHSQAFPDLCVHNRLASIKRQPPCSLPSIA